MQRIIMLSMLATMPWLSAPAAAQTYIGASVGGVEARVADNAQSTSALTALGFGNAQSSLDKRDSGYRLHVGYKFSRHFAAELGYVDLGKHQIDSRVTFGNAVPGSLSNNITVDGFDVSLVGEYPLGGRLSAFGRVGAFTAEAKSVVMANGAIALFSGDGARREKRDTQAVYGLGLAYALTPAVSLRGEWSRFDQIKRFDVVGVERKGDVDLYSIGLTYRFF